MDNEALEWCLYCWLWINFPYFTSIFFIEHVLLYRAQLTIQQATYFNVIGHVKSEPFKYISCDRFILTTLYLTLQKLERFVKISLRHSVKEFFWRGNKFIYLFIASNSTITSINQRNWTKQLKNYPAGIYLLKVNNRNTRTRCQICSKIIIKTPERCHAYFTLWPGISIDNFKHVIACWVHLISS